MSTIASKLSVAAVTATAARLTLGLVFFVFGLNGFLHFLPQPPMTGAPAELLGAFAASGYMFPLIKGTEIAGGLLLLSGRFVPLALAILAPIIVNIVAFHVALAPAGLPMALAVLAAEVFLAWSYRAAFAPMLRARAEAHVVDRDTVPAGVAAAT